MPEEMPFCDYYSQRYATGARNFVASGEYPRPLQRLQE